MPGGAPGVRLCSDRADLQKWQVVQVVHEAVSWTLLQCMPFGSVHGVPDSYSFRRRRCSLVYCSLRGKRGCSWHTELQLRPVPGRACPAARP